MKKYKKLTLKDFGVKREEKVLNNSCRVVLYEKKNSPLYFGVRFLAGSRFNDKEGLAHFVEHMLVSGTEKFKSKDLLSMYLERYGGSFGLSTNNNFININAEIGEVSDIDILLDFLNEIINNPSFNNDSFLAEKDSIINEIGNANTLPVKFFGEIFLNTFYKNTPLEKNNLGTEDSVNSIELKDVISFYKKNITAQNCTIVVSGDIKIKKLLRKIEQKIKFKNLGENKINKKIHPLPNNGERVLVENIISNQSLITIGFRVGTKFEQSPELELIKYILAGGRASRLEKKLRYENGLVYSVSANYDTYQDAGGFFIKTSTSAKNVERVIEIILSEIESIRKNGVTEEELDFVKDKIYKSSKKDFQTSEDWINANSSREALCKDSKINLDFINHMMVVSNSDIIKIASEYLLKERAFIGLYDKNKDQLA